MRSHSRKAAFIALAVTLLVPFASPRPAAANCGAEGCPLSARGPEARIGRFLFGVRYQLVQQDMLWNGSHEVSAEEAYAGEDVGHEVEQLTRTKTLNADVRVRVLSRLELAVTMPWLDRVHQHSVEHHTGFFIPYEWHMQGPGDAVVTTAWTAIAPSSEHGHSLVLQAGVKLPTGETNAGEVYGEQPEPPARLGSGSTDFLAAAQYQRSFSVPGLGSAPARLPVSLGVSGRLNGVGTENYRVGNSWQADLGASYPLMRGLRLLGQVNVSGNARDDVGDTDAEPHHTGGNVGFASPGLQADLLPGVSAFGYYQFRLWQYSNGVQLVSPYHLVFGLGYAFH